jgi:hypothetical protein
MAFYTPEHRDEVMAKANSEINRITAVKESTAWMIFDLLAIQINELQGMKNELQGLNSTMESILEILKNKDEDQSIEFLKPRGKQ